MLNLHTRIHFDEVETTVFIQEFKRAGSDVTHVLQAVTQASKTCARLLGRLQARVLLPVLFDVDVAVNNRDRRVDRVTLLITTLELRHGVVLRETIPSKRYHRQRLLLLRLL